MQQETSNPNHCCYATTKWVGNFQGIIGIFSLQCQYLAIILEWRSILGPLLVNLGNVGVSDIIITLNCFLQNGKFTVESAVEWRQCLDVVGLNLLKDLWLHSIEMQVIWSWKTATWRTILVFWPSTIPAVLHFTATVAHRLSWLFCTEHLKSNNED